MRLNYRLVSIVMMACALRPLAATAQNESLLIGPGDLVQMDVMDTPEMEQQVRVTDAGNIPLAYIGNVHVAGETPAQAASVVETVLVHKKVMLHPQVNLRIVEYATQNVSILGEVRNPGTYPITTPQSILKVLSLAGGLMPDADRQITIKRTGNPNATTYYVANDPKRALSDLVLVHPGDTVLVPHAPMIYIMGDVSRPGGYAIATNDSRLTIMQAIAIAGSANKTSVRRHVRLIRTTVNGTVDIPVPLNKIEKGKAPDIALQANDILYVPFSWMKNTAMSSSSIVSSTAGAAVYAIP